MSVWSQKPYEQIKQTSRAIKIELQYMKIDFLVMDIVVKIVYIQNWSIWLVNVYPYVVD